MCVCYLPIARDTNLSSGMHLDDMKSKRKLAVNETEELHVVQTSLLSVLMRLCEDNLDALYIFGVIETGLGLIVFAL